MISALLSAGILQGILLIIFLLRKTTDRGTSRILANLILVMVLHLGLVVLDVRGLFPQYPHFSRLSWLLPLLYGPLIILLTKSIVSPRRHFDKRLLLLALPFCIYLILLLPYFASPAEMKAAYLNDPKKVFQADFGWMNHLTNYLHIGFVSAALVIFYRWKKIAASRDQQASTVWLAQFLWTFWAILIFALFTFYSKKYHLPYFSNIYPKHFLFAVLFVYWLAYKVLQRKEENIPVEEEADTIKNKYAKTGLDATTAKSISETIEKFMQTEKPYLNPELSLNDLAEKMNLTKHQLSQVINSEMQMNFYEFINGYRLNQFKSEVLNPVNSHLSLLGIAMECGFNSKAAFNQYFKKKEGMTPTEFVRNKKSHA